MDEAFDNRERQTIERLVVARFGLAEDECRSLIAAAETAVAESHQLHRFTRAVKDQFAPAERVELIEMLWEVAYADGVLHDFEANLLRRIGGLIYVSDRDSGDARRKQGYQGRQPERGWPSIRRADEAADWDPDEKCERHS